MMKTLTLLVYAGLFGCFHSTLNSDMGYMIFHVRMGSFPINVPVPGLYGHGKGSYGQAGAPYGLRACPIFARTGPVLTRGYRPCKGWPGNRPSTGMVRVSLPFLCVCVCVWERERERESCSSFLLPFFLGGGCKGKPLLLSWRHIVVCVCRLRILSSTPLPNCFWNWRTRRTCAVRTQFSASFVSSEQQGNTN